MIVIFKAMHLRDENLSVAIVEAGEVGCGTTGGNSGHLDMTADLNFSDLLSKFGKERASLIVRSNIEAIAQVEKWSKV